MLRYSELRCIFYSADALRSCSLFVLKCNWWSCLRCIRLCILFSHVTCTVDGKNTVKTYRSNTGNSTGWDLWKNSKFGDFQCTAPTTGFYLLKTPKFPPEFNYALLAVLNRLSEWFTTAWINLIKKNLACSRRKPHFPVWLSVLIMGNQCVQTPCIQSIKNSDSITLGFYYLF